MSKYEWESGDIKFSCKEYRKFKQTIREEFNKLQAARLAFALTIYGQLVAAGKGQRNFNYKDAEQRLNGGAVTNGGFTSYSREHDYLVYKSMFFDKVPLTPEEKERKLKERYPVTPEWQAIVDNAVKFVERSKPRKPRKNDFPLATNKDNHFDAGSEADINFKDADRIVHWSVGENNHSCERAHAEPMGKVFFSALSRVVWTRGTGGEIVGNDEYNRESQDSGGGGNYTKQSFGPKSSERPFRRMRLAFR